MPQVLWLFEYPVAGGGEHSLLAAWPQLRAAGIEPVAACPTGPIVELLRAAGVPHLDYDLRPHGGRHSQTARREKLAELLQRTTPALLHANSLAMSRLLGPVSRAAGIPAIGHIRDIVGLSTRAIEDINQLDRIIAVSQETREFHLAQGLDPERSMVLHNGVDLNRFAPRAATGWVHEQLQLPADALLAGDLGQLIRRKGHDVMLAAAKSLLPKFPHLHWVIAGECHSQKDEAKSHLAELHATAAECQGRVHLLGSVQPAEHLLNELHLLVHPARQEPLGRVLLEAAACGCAIIATDVGGTRSIFPQVIESSVEADGCKSPMAWLVPPNDAEAIAEAVEELLEKEALRQRLSQEARRRAEEEFDAEVAGRKLADVYKQLLQQSL